MILEGPYILEGQSKTDLGSVFRGYSIGEGRWTSLVLVLKSLNTASGVWFSKALDPNNPVRSGILKQEMLLQGTIKIVLEVDTLLKSTGIWFL